MSQTLHEHVETLVAFAHTGFHNARQDTGTSFDAGKHRVPLDAGAAASEVDESVTGRKTGRVYCVPISYSIDGSDLVCFTDAGWWKNLRGGGAVGVVVGGHRRNGTAEVVRGPAVAEQLTWRAVRRDAKYHGVRFDAGHEPTPADVTRATLTTVMTRIRLDGTGTGTR